jgi:hypothetical protein
MLNGFTFVIITDGNAEHRVNEMVDNIRLRAGLRHFEILIVGGSTQGEEIFRACQTLKYIPAPNEWITTKKNTAAWVAKYPQLVVMHDYFLLDDYWFEGYEEFAQLEWDICSNPQFLQNGKRHFTDWVTWDDPQYGRYHSLDYWDWTRTQHQYISGGYFVCKRKVLIEQPFNTTMGPGMPEDVEWSLRVRDKYKIKCNPYSKVRHNKIHRDCK